MRARRVALPEGMEVWATHPDEVKIIHQEIFVERQYERHGVSVPDGGIVFDVGANIGLFGLHLVRSVPGLRLFAFEPIPELFDALDRNIREHVPGGTARRLGLADRRGEAIFEFDRFATYTATMHPGVYEEGARKDAGARAWAKAGLRDLERFSPRGHTALRALHACLDAPVIGVSALAAVRMWHLGVRVRRRAFLRRIACPLDTLSSVFAETRLPRIDLVKIDVEGAEEEVLAGIREEDWSRLRQLVIEVHDVNGRLDRMDRLLQTKGYKTVVDRQDWALLELLRIHTLYAIRSGDFASGAKGE